MRAPCLKVELDGTEVLPKKNAPLKWGEDVLDNEARDAIRESEAADDEDDEDDEDEQFELAQLDSDDDYEEGEEAIPQDVMMEHIKTLARYGFSDAHKLARLKLQEWDDLARNVGIAEEQEHSVMLAIGIKKRKKVWNVVKYFCLFVGLLSFNSPLFKNKGVLEKIAVNTRFAFLTP